MLCLEVQDVVDLESAVRLCGYGQLVASAFVGNEQLLAGGYRLLVLFWASGCCLSLRRLGEQIHLGRNALRASPIPILASEDNRCTNLGRERRGQKC